MCVWRGGAKSDLEHCAYHRKNPGFALDLSDTFSTRAIVHDRQTRYRDSLNIPSCRINAGQRAFCHRGVKMWNNFSKDLREIMNTKVFKRRLINELICNMN